MVTDGPFGMPGVGINNIPPDNRRGRRWGPTYPRQHLLNENGQQSRPPQRSYRPNPTFRSGVQTAPPPTRQMQPEIHRQRNEMGRMQPEKLRGNNCIAGHGRASPMQPRFQAIYQEFENMKKMGLVLNAEPKTEVTPSPKCANQTVPKSTEKRRTSSEDFAEAMRIFMKSYLPTSSFPSVKPVDDWSKEAGNLLNELTDKESQSDADTSVWKIPNDATRVCSGVASGGRLNANPWSTTPPKPHEREAGSGYFDIHRHIMEINPSPYPGGSPLSSDQLSSNHSSDNDADDESTQSSTENACSKTIGAKKSLKRRFHSSFTCSTMDSGYLSSANESDGARGCGVNSRFPGTSVDSDDVSSECGFTSSTCPSWPTSPSRVTLPDQSKGNGGWADGQTRHVPPVSTQMNTHRTALPQGPAIPMTCPPIPPPMPPFLTTMARIPIPPPPHFLPGQIHPVVSVSQPPMASMSRLPPGLPHVPGLAVMGPAPPLTYAQQLRVNPVQTAVAESSGQDALVANGAYHKHKAWITDEILEMIAVRDRLYKRMKKHPAPDIVEMYKKVRNMVVGMTRNAKRSYEKQFEEHQMEQRLRNSRCGENFGHLNFVPPHVQQPW